MQGVTSPALAGLRPPPVDAPTRRYVSAQDVVLLPSIEEEVCDSRRVDLILGTFSHLLISEMAETDEVDLNKIITYDLSIRFEPLLLALRSKADQNEVQQLQKLVASQAAQLDMVKSMLDSGAGSGANDDGSPSAGGGGGSMAAVMNLAAEVASMKEERAKDAARIEMLEKQLADGAHAAPGSPTGMKRAASFRHGSAGANGKDADGAAAKDGMDIETLNLRITSLEDELHNVLAQISYELGKAKPAAVSPTATSPAAPAAAAPGQASPPAAAAAPSTVPPAATETSPTSSRGPSPPLLRARSFQAAQENLAAQGVSSPRLDEAAALVSKGASPAAVVQTSAIAAAAAAVADAGPKLELQGLFGGFDFGADIRAVAEKLQGIVAQFAPTAAIAEEAKRIADEANARLSEISAYHDARIQDLEKATGLPVGGNPAIPRPGSGVNGAGIQGATGSAGASGSSPTASLATSALASAASPRQGASGTAGVNGSNGDGGATGSTSEAALSPTGLRADLDFLRAQFDALVGSNPAFAAAVASVQPGDGVTSAAFGGAAGGGTGAGSPGKAGANGTSPSAAGASGSSTGGPVLARQGSFSSLTGDALVEALKQEVLQINSKLVMMAKKQADDTAAMWRGLEGGDAALARELQAIKADMGGGGYGGGYNAGGGGGGASSTPVKGGAGSSSSSSSPSHPPPAASAATPRPGAGGNTDDLARRLGQLEGGMIGVNAAVSKAAGEVAGLRANLETLSKTVESRTGLGSGLGGGSQAGAAPNSGRKGDNGANGSNSSASGGGNIDEKALYSFAESITATLLVMSGLADDGATISKQLQGKGLSTIASRAAEAAATARQSATVQQVRSINNSFSNYEVRIKMLEDRPIAEPPAPPPEPVDLSPLNSAVDDLRGAKADRGELDGRLAVLQEALTSVTRRVNDYMKQLQAVLAARPSTSAGGRGDPQAQTQSGPGGERGALVKQQLLRDFKCLSCDQPLHNVTSDRGDYAANNQFSQHVHMNKGYAFNQTTGGAGGAGRSASPASHARTARPPSAHEFEGRRSSPDRNLMARPGTSAGYPSNYSVLPNGQVIARPVPVMGLGMQGVVIQGQVPSGAATASGRPASRAAGALSPGSNTSPSAVDMGFEPPSQQQQQPGLGDGTRLPPLEGAVGTPAPSGHRVINRRGSGVAVPGTGGAMVAVPPSIVDLKGNAIPQYFMDPSMVQ